MKTSGLPGWALPVGLAVVVFGLVAVALSRGPDVLDPDTPEGTVQEYLMALDEGRYEDVIALLHPQWGGTCTAEDLEFTGVTDFTARLGHVSNSGGRVVFETFTDVGFDGERPIGPEATEFVEVTITRNDTGGLGGGWEEYAVFELVDDDGFYWIVGDPWPYFTWNCQVNR